MSQQLQVTRSMPMAMENSNVEMAMPFNEMSQPNANSQCQCRRQCRASACLQINVT